MSAASTSKDINTYATNVLGRPRPWSTVREECCHYRSWRVSPFALIYPSNLSLLPHGVETTVYGRTRLLIALYSCRSNDLPLANSGIGLETTILFLREGASVLMTDISDDALSKAIAKAKEMAPNMTGKVDTKKVDVSKEADVEAAVEHLDDWGGVDIMFNNAGIMHADDDGEKPVPIRILQETN